MTEPVYRLSWQLSVIPHFDFHLRKGDLTVIVARRSRNFKEFGFALVLVRIDTLAAHCLVSVTLEFVWISGKYNYHYLRTTTTWPLVTSGYFPFLIVNCCTAPSDRYLTTCKIAVDVEYFQCLKLTFTQIKNCNNNFKYSISWMFLTHWTFFCMLYIQAKKIGKKNAEFKFLPEPRWPGQNK